MNLSNKELPAEMSGTYGHLVVSATLPVVIVLIYSRQMKMDGSGLDQVQKLEQPLNGILATGASPEDTIKLNRITVKLPKAMMNHAYRF